MTPDEKGDLIERFRASSIAAEKISDEASDPIQKAFYLGRAMAWNEAASLVRQEP